VRANLYSLVEVVAELIVPHSSLDSSVDIPFSEGPVNLNWQAIMKTVNDDPYEFFNEGGWGFLSTNDDVSRQIQISLSFPHPRGGSADDRKLNLVSCGMQEPGSSDDSEEGSEFAASDVEDDEDVSDFSDESAYSDGSESGSDASDLSDSGEEWSDAERRLERKEKSKAGGDDSDDDRGKKSGSSKSKAKSGGRR
jgi:hypothetical protein